MGNQLGGHGGQVYQLAKKLDRSVESLIDFSASVNPLGPPASVLKAMGEAVERCRHYPDPSSEDLRLQLAHEHKVSAESILVGNGSVELIRILPQALGLRQACVVGPTFSEFETSLRLARVKYTEVHAVSNQRYAPPVEKLHAILQGWKAAFSREKGRTSLRYHAVFVCNPNSPTGRRMAPQDLRRIIKEVHQVGGWLIVDEAFMDWSPSYSLMKDIPKWPRLLVLRSFTKFFAIPGIRLGYLVGDPAVVHTISQHVTPWSVNHVAQAAGVAALADSRFRHQSQALMRREREGLLRELRTIPELRVIPSYANFVMVELGAGLVADDMVVRLEEKGILVRDCRTFSGMTQAALRVAVLGKQDNQRLVRALKRTIQDVVSYNV